MLVKNNGTIWPDDASTQQSAAMHSLWVGGRDVNGQLKVAAMRYGQMGNDYYPGPLNIVNAMVDADNCIAYDRIWKIEKWQVDEFKVRLNQPDYAIPDVILNWPAHSDISQGFGYNLATYYDTDGSGDYNPLAGDFPYYNQDTVPDLEYRRMMLKGDQTLWWVMNDMGDIHTESGGNPIGIEVRCMAYGFNTCGPLADVTFYEYEIINRGSFTLVDTYVGLWVDADAGFAQNNRSQCDVARSLGYAFDMPNGNGNATHACGINLLGGPYLDNDGMDNDGDGIADNEVFGMSKFLTGASDNVAAEPNTVSDFYNLLRGHWTNGNSICYGGGGQESSGCNGIDADFMFPGDSDPLGVGTGGVPQTPWFDENVGGIPFDRRFIMSAGPFTLEPGAVHSFQYAVVMATETDGSDPIPQLLANSDLVRSVFDSAFFNMPCCTPDVAISYQHPEQLRFLFASVEEGESYLWEFGDGSTSTDRFPTHIYPAVGTYEVCLTVTNDCGSDMVCEVVDWTVGIAETEMELNLVIHPNPSSDMFNFSVGVGTISSISICDAIGRVVVMQNAISSSATVSVAGIAPGVYFATVTTNKGVAVQRVVVQ